MQRLTQASKPEPLKQDTQKKNIYIQQNINTNKKTKLNYSYKEIITNFKLIF